MSTSAQPLIAIIGGNALGNLPDLVVRQRRVERTAFGEPSSPLIFGQLHQHCVVFLARHGTSFTLAPEEVNDLANIAALQNVGAQAIIGISSAVALCESLKVGDFVLPDQLIDINNNRPSRFPRADPMPYKPLPFSEPYDGRWRHILMKSAPAHLRVHPQGIYVLTNGYRSETSAEAQCFRQWGGTALGTTGAQEAALARDIDLPYVSILVVVRHIVNQDTPTLLRGHEVAKNLSTWMGHLAL